jgi:hypothetical protein
MDAAGLQCQYPQRLTALANARNRTNLLLKCQSADWGGRPLMLWLKILLCYCVLAAVLVWFGYRSRGVWPEQDPADEPGKVAPPPP